MRSDTVLGRSLTVAWSGPQLRRLRLASGLVLFSYVASHLINHALGNASVAAMQAMLTVQTWIWQGVIGSLAFYGALAVHIALGVYALVVRRYARWTRTEAIQMGFGLLIPALLANHITVTRLSLVAFGVDKGYPQELAVLWTLAPMQGLLQVAVLIVAWVHACIGLHFVLRLMPWSQRAAPLLLAAALLIPVLALLGFVAGGRDIARVLATPEGRAAVLDPALAGTPAQAAILAAARDAFLACYAGVIVAALGLRQLRRIRETRNAGICITYAAGFSVRVPLGFSVLEASRFAGQPHASVCGGKGRCSTCRVRIVASTHPLPPPSHSEREVLLRVGVDPGQVRLACQLRPRHDIALGPLIPPETSRAFVVNRTHNPGGDERFLVVMFIDMRDSSGLAQSMLPFDGMFVVGRFLAAVASAVVAAGGEPNQYLGDGVLALFGLHCEPERAANQAFDAIDRILANIHAFNTVFAGEMGRRVRFGVGVHCGRVIVGQVGVGRHVTTTALGEPVNTAARLEAHTRAVGCDALVSAAVFAAADRAPPADPGHMIALRGRGEQIVAFAIGADPHDARPASRPQQALPDIVSTSTSRGKC